MEQRINNAVLCEFGILELYLISIDITDIIPVAHPPAHIYTPDEVLTPMQGETGERWRKLCEEAAVEQDLDRLLQLVKEISRILEEKEERLKKARSNWVTAA